MIFLPGTDKQIKFLLKDYSPSGKKILIAGGGTDKIILKFKDAGSDDITVISNNSIDVVDLRMKTSGKNLKVRIMDYENTDFRDGSFDLVYSQASFSIKERKNIFKEVSRILLPDGILCIGEIIRTADDIPRFMQEVWNSSGISPLTIAAQIQFYKDAGFAVVSQENLSYTLNDFYNSGKKMLQKFIDEGSNEEKNRYKKMLNKISHESNAYLNLGGKKYMEFHAFILKRTA